MIREGKQQGWLHLPVSALQPWAKLNGARMHSVDAGTSEEYPERGAGIFASQDLTADDASLRCIMTVPRDLVLSKERVAEHAKADQDLRAVFEALGEFGQSSRISILTFLLTQCMLQNPAVTERHFTRSPFTSYVRLLPLEHLPTFWSQASYDLLTGSTLLPAVKAKLASLYREYNTFRERTSPIEWCQRIWWDEVDGILSFDDWLQVDAMYRSRALEFPGIGDCMAPCIDMANHASGDKTSAIYEVDGIGDAVLLLRPNIPVSRGDELTITYGDEKGACEMLFSYGFLEDGIGRAKELFLDLSMPDDDPLAKAKATVAKSAPGFKIVETEDGVRWESDYIWIVCVNEEDGLKFMIERTVDSKEDLTAVWKDEPFDSAVNLRQRLEQDNTMWDVFQLRAVTLLQERVATQLQELYGSDDDVEKMCKDLESHGIDKRTAALALKLRQLEADLLEEAYAYFETQKEALMASDAVSSYLAAMSAPAEGEVEDFS